MADKDFNKDQSRYGDNPAEPNHINQSLFRNQRAAGIAGAPKLPSNVIGESVPKDGASDFAFRRGYFTE